MNLKLIQGDYTMPGGQKAPQLTDPAEIELWESICSHQEKPFTTFGRGRRPGTQLSYTIRGAEMFVSNRAKSITRATILYAFHKVREMEEQGIAVSGPKAIGVHGDSYIFAVFKEIGVINAVGKSGNILDSRDMIEANKAKEAIPMPRPKGSIPWKVYFSFSIPYIYRKDSESFCERLNPPKHSPLDFKQRQGYFLPLHE